MTTSSITAALPGTASSTSRGQSCPSACAIGHIGPDQRDLVLEPAPGDENIKNEKSKGEYRRYYDQLQTSKPILAGAEQQYQSAIEIYRAQIQAFGRNLPVNLQ